MRLYKFILLTILFCLVGLSEVLASDYMNVDEPAQNNMALPAIQQDVQLVKNPAQLGFAMFLRLIASLYIDVGDAGSAVYFLRAAAKDGDATAQALLLMFVEPEREQSESYDEEEPVVPDNLDEQDGQDIQQLFE